MKNVMLKSVLLAVMALFITVSTIAVPVDSAIDTQIEKSELALEKGRDIDFWVTSKEGCRFHVVGEASLLSLSFSGSVTGTSEPPCPNGTWTFELSAQGGGPIQVGGDVEIVKYLNRSPDLVHNIAEKVGLLK